MSFPRPHPLLVAGAVIIALTVSGSAARSDPAGYTVLGSGFTGMPFALGGNLVAESDTLGVTIRDYCIARAPQVVGWFDHSAYIFWSEILADGPLVVGLSGDVGLGVIGFSVVDFSEPLAPIHYGDFSGMAFASGWLHGGALIAMTDNVLVAYDLTHRDAPDLSMFLQIGVHAGSRWPAAVGNTLYVIDHGARIRALNVTDPRHPATLGSPALAGERIDALAAGDGVLYALVAKDVGRPGERLDLVTCDVGTPTAPVETSRVLLFSGPGAAGRALVREDDLLVAAGSDGKVRAFGLADVRHPTTGWTVLHDCNRLVVTSGALLVREGRDLIVYERTAWDGSPTAPRRRSPLPRLDAVIGEGPIQLVKYHDRSRRLGTLDVSDPFQPRLGPDTNVFPGATPQCAGGVVLVASDGGCLYDFKDGQLSPRGCIFTPGVPSVYRLWSPEVVTSEALRFEQGITLWDTSDLDHPQQRGHIDELTVFGVGDGRLLAGFAGDARLYDIGNLAAPVPLAALADPGEVVRAAFWHGHLYASTIRGGQICLDTWDLVDPAMPRRVASAVLPGAALFLDRHGSRLYAQSDRVAVVFDLAAAGAPVQLGLPLHCGFTHPAFAVNGDVVTLTTDLVTVRNDGLPPAPAPQPAAAVAVTLSPAWPNPCNPATALEFTLDAGRELTLSVYDIRGRHVADVARGRFGAGTHEVTWNGTDADGAAVATGVYLLRLHGKGVEAATTVTLMK